MEDLKQYYDGADWALDYVLALMTGKIKLVDHIE
jgi:hypothetical protein